MKNYFQRSKCSRHTCAKCPSWHRSNKNVLVLDHLARRSCKRMRSAIKEELREQKLSFYRTAGRYDIIYTCAAASHLLYIYRNTDILYINLTLVRQLKTTRSRKWSRWLTPIMSILVNVLRTRHVRLLLEIRGWVEKRREMEAGTSQPVDLTSC